MSYSQPPRVEFSEFTPAEQLARMFHESYERHASNMFGYNPRPWEMLTEADQKLRVNVARELIERDVVKILPDCPHTHTRLTRIEVRQCERCKSFPRLRGSY